MSVYTEKDLFDFMESERKVKVTCTDGQVFIGQCWAYSEIQAEEDYNIFEPILDIRDTIIGLSEISKIEYCD